MREIIRHTPLFAVEAVVLDTETTGLDPRSARIVEIGAVVVRDGAVVPTDTFRQLVATPERIPATATAIHGIVDSDLVGAPAFPEAFDELQSFVGPRPVIGHTIGFDLAVLARECERARLRPPSWATLDTRLLAEVVAPTLAGFSLESLAAWLGVEVHDRHRALGDAILTARVFVALLPRLRERGIRTIGEAAGACRRVANAQDDHRRAGWVEPGADLAQADRHGIARRLDGYAYRHQLREVMSAPPICVPDDMSLGEVLASLIERRVSSHFVGDPEAPAAGLGIVTERDILRALGARGAEVLDAPVAEIATRPLVTVGEREFVYRAIGRMRRFDIRHLAVVGHDGLLRGAVSARDLLKLRADAAIVLGDDIDQAPDVPSLARAWARVPAMAEALLGEEIGGSDIAGIVARELGALTRRAGELAAAELEQGGRGVPPCGYALLVLGSAGRGESLLALDQDHALIFAEGAPDGPEDRWFEAFGRRVAEILHQVGVPYCSGGVMSGNAAFRGSLATWRERVARWIGRASPQDLLNVDIFYDMRPVLGDGAMAEDLWQEAWRAAAASPGFLRLLAEGAGEQASPIGFLGRVRSEDGRIDLKRHGLWPIVQSVRLMALRHGVARRSTAERLKGLQALAIGGGSDLLAAVEAHRRFLTRILRAQLADLAAGRPASNRVPLALAQAEGGAAQLRADLRLAASLSELARDQLARA